MHPDKKEIDPNLLYPDVLTTIPTSSGLTEGRMCHYVAYSNRHLAAIVIGHTEIFVGTSVADLAVFTNMESVNGVKNFGMQFHQSVAYDENKTPGTWHWIEKA